MKPQATPPAKDDDGEAKWWKEDLERHNRFCEQVQKAGHCVGPVGKPPPLNEDGSLKAASEEMPPDDEEKPADV